MNMLNEQQVDTFRTSGFLTLPEISTAAEVASLLPIFERLFASQAGRREGAFYDLLNDEISTPRGRLLEIINPVNYAPELRHTVFRSNALQIARTLLGPGARPIFEHAILKPAHQGATTPWHQDEAYRHDTDVKYEQVSFWMPLQAATLENGCMRYVPGSHLGGVREHRSFHGDNRVQAIECVVEPLEGVNCPLPAGGVAIHQGRTLHCAGPNLSSEPRYAYILVFRSPSERVANPSFFPWVRERRSASIARRKAWLRRGGYVLETFRRLRYRVFWATPSVATVSSARTRWRVIVSVCLVGALVGSAVMFFF